MPRYFFHLRRDGVRLDDDKGQQLANPDETWEAARHAALGLMNTGADGTAVWPDCYFEVAHEQQQIVFEFPFRDAVETSGSGPN